jgi:hypothetical protein
LTPLSKGHNVIGYKWVFKTKRDAIGEIVHSKERLLVRRILQVYGIDVNETFVPVTKFTTFRCILTIGVALDLEMHQMDVETTFLSRDLEEDLYMEQLNRFVQCGQKHLMCKLKKSLWPQGHGIKGSLQPSWIWDSIVASWIIAYTLFRKDSMR